MKRTLKMTAIAVAIAGATLGMVGQAQAAVCTTLATVAAWSAGAGSCTDPDGDMLFTFGSLGGTFPTTTLFSVSETTIGGVDIYSIGFDWDSYAGGGTISYRITSLDPLLELISSSSLDTVVVGATVATKTLSDVGAGTPFLTLTSTAGSHDPLGGGEVNFAGRTSINVVDTLTGYTDGRLFYHVDNTFNASAVPEPGSIALLGLGLAGLGFMRRRKV